MKHILPYLLAVLICSVSFAGCDREVAPDADKDRVSLELGTDKTPEQETPDETLDNTRPTPNPQEQKNEPVLPSKPQEKQDEPSSPSTPQNQTPPQAPSEPEKEKSSQAEQTEKPIKNPSSSPLPFPQELQQRPAQELNKNPNNLDPRLYSVFKNVMEQNFSRKEGTLSVYCLNADGTEGVYELKFDLTNAYDEQGRLNKKMAIKAQMKIAETLQSGYNYGQGKEESYKSYEDYNNTLEWLKTPLLCDGFALENFSDLTLTSKDGHYLIEATYSPEALKKIYGKEIYGTVQSFIQIDSQGNLEVLEWEQSEMIDDYPTVSACSKYTFS